MSVRSMRATVIALAAIISVCPLFAGGKQEAGSSGASATTAGGLPPYTIQWYMPNSVQPDQDAVNAAISAIAQKKINAKVNITFIDWGSYDQKMQVMMASQQGMDLIFTSNWTNDYISAVNKGAYNEITMAMLKQYAPNVLAGVPVACWPAANVNGKLYAVINTQVEGRTPGLILQKKYADQYGLDVSKVKKLADLTDFFTKVHSGDRNVYAFELNSNTTLFNDIAVSFGIEVFSQTNPAALYINDRSTKVMNYFAAPETRQFLELLHGWYQKGIIRQDAVTVKDDSADMLAGKVVSVPQVINPDTAANQAARMGLTAADLVTPVFSKTFMSTGSIIATMTAISRTSKDPTRALMLYNLLYDKNDTTIFNMISYGIKDKHYTLDGDVATPIANSGYLVACGWEYGNMFNSYRQSKAQPEWYPAGPDMNASAVTSSVLGFSFNPEPVKTELAQCASVVNEYYVPLFTGSVDPDAVLPPFLDKLRNAGADKVIAEMQKQIDAWKATR